MCSCNVSCMILVRWFFWTKMHICCQVGKNFSEHETHTYMVFIQMEVLVNQTFRLDFLCSLLLHASSISFSTFTCVEKTFNLMNFIHSDELAQVICHFQTSIHRPWTWLSLAWIAVISPNAPAAPVSPGSSVPVAVVPSGSSVPAAGTSSGIGALAIAHVPASQLKTRWGKLTAAARSGSVTSFDLRNYLHKGLRPPALGVFSLAFDLLFCKSNSAILASVMSFLIVLFLIQLILNICELLW